MLLTSKLGEDLAEVLGANKERLLNWFQDIRAWGTCCMSKESFIWINITGAPIHAWNIEFFKLLVSPVGTFIKVDQATHQKERLDVARVLVCSSSPTIINLVVRVNIDDTVFSLRFLEDIFRFNTSRLNSDGVVPPTNHNSSTGSDSEGDNFYEAMGSVGDCGVGLTESPRLHYVSLNSKISMVPDSLGGGTPSLIGLQLGVRISKVLFTEMAGLERSTLC